MNKTKCLHHTIWITLLLIIAQLSACSPTVVLPDLQLASQLTIQNIWDGILPCGGEYIHPYVRTTRLNKTLAQFEGTVEYLYGEKKLERPISVPLDRMKSFFEIMKKADIENGEFQQMMCDPRVYDTIEFQSGNNTIKFIGDCGGGPWEVRWSERSNVKYHVEREIPYQALAILTSLIDEVGELNRDVCSIDP